MITAFLQGRLWGARAYDWSVAQECEARSAYNAILNDYAPWSDLTVLDMGCASGEFARRVAARGARVTGIDAALEMVEIAEHRVPDAVFWVGDMEELPYADASFDVVTGLDILGCAAEPLRALTEAARVTRPGGRIIMMIWGSTDECEAAPYLEAVAAKLPPAEPMPAGPFALSAPGALEALFEEAGLAVGDRRAVECSWFYPDEGTALRGLLSTGAAVSAINHAGEGVVGEAVLRAIAPFRCRSGVYLLRNKFHYLVGTR